MHKHISLYYYYNLCQLVNWLLSGKDIEDFVVFKNICESNMYYFQTLYREPARVKGLKAKSENCSKMF